MVVEGDNAHQVMMKLWHDVGVSCWEGGEEEILRRVGAVGRATFCSEKGLECAWVDIHAGGVVGEVVAVGSVVGYCGILLGKEGVWGRATGRGRRNRSIS